ncbi:MAG TPA: LuxR C-terminal-related transcriptional regulator, partial [Candidatus Dormibacteraeota bacterium]|nr:LuxR C-terminal-related transcriptional regulator [Candidatus Dormibacteraeota bacterium]
GKTRLAIRAAEWVAPNYVDGAWFVELAGVDGPGVERAVLAALPISRRGRGGLAGLGGELAHLQLLLVLDNCEHVRAECAEVVHTLTRCCPQLSVLATSRHPLGVAGEQVRRVEPLTVPEAADAGCLVWSASESVRLFVERARAARPEFRLDEETAPAVAEICRRLDGLPLAIELAAARLAVLSPAEVLARLDDPFRLLSGRCTVAPERHRSLAAALEWGYALLSPPEATMFARLGIFATGWDLDAAEAVCAGGPIGARDVLDLITAVVAHSLVAVERRGSATRFRMLGSAARFALAKLEETEGVDGVAERHARWCLERAERAARERGGPHPERWLDALEEDHAEFRAALAWARSRDRGDIALALGGALSWFWETRGHVTEGIEWLRWAVAHGAGADPEVRARALRGAGILTWLLGDAASAMPLVDEAVGLYRGAGNEEEASGCVCSSSFHVCANPIHSLPTVEADLVRLRGLEDWGRLARSLVNAGVAHFFVSDAGRAKACFEESLALPREEVEAEVVVDALLGLGRVSVLSGDLGDAERSLTQAIEVAGPTGDGDARSTALGWIGEIRRLRGDHDGARAAIAEATELAREDGLPLSLARCQQFLGRLETAEGNLEFARKLLTASLEAPGAGQMPYHRVRSLQALSEIALVAGETQGVRALLDEAVALARATGDRQAQGHALSSLALLSSREGDADRAATLVHEALQVQERIGDVIGIISSLETLAELAAASGRGVVAARLFGAAQRARDARGCCLPPGGERALLRRLPQLAGLLESGDWAQAVSEGANLSAAEAVSYAARGRGSKDRPLTGWDSLTRAERDIAHLVADGMSNREIGDRLLVSARTVETHLSHIFRKVPVANRRELCRVARERNLVEASAAI